jgi:hypothetical protein
LDDPGAGAVNTDDFDWWWLIDLDLLALSR